MNTAALVDTLAEKHGLSKTDARAILDTTFDAIVDSVNKGDDVQLSGVGKFALKETKERQGRNPSTGEPMTIAAQRKITFTPAKAVKDKLNG
ncbi:HU family DNA-binding protein [Erythrobacter aureus]|uniref:HU family DNA-binding protein n=1 Tax=Erythrobacter aureus TaxID=2182384 RepID=A0A345YJB8_9SPHN|nr:HU family DNA-binding protein [Erythrobacter aureus]AXK44020.1 HU family DNA-binding protein [Erythrobacter aureus]